MTPANIGQLPPEPSGNAPATASARRRPRNRIFFLFVIGLLAAGAALPMIGNGTGASFTATTTNGSNVVSNGTVSMTNVAGTAISGSNCSSATVSGTCATLLGTGNTGFKPGGSDVSNSVTITYTGSITTSDFRLYASSYSSKAAGSGSFCTAGNPGSLVDLLVTVGSASPSLLFPVASTTTTSAISNGATVTTIAVGSAPALASGAQIILYSAGTYQQFTTSGVVSSGATSIPVVSQTASAAFGSGSQVAKQGTLDAFATTYTSAANGLQLKGGTNGAGSTGVWATNDNSQFNVKLHLDSTADNTYQGCQSQSDLVWYATQ
jgi:hypothetical protein